MVPSKNGYVCSQLSDTACTMEAQQPDGFPAVFDVIQNDFGIVLVFQGAIVDDQVVNRSPVLQGIANGQELQNASAVDVRNWIQYCLAGNPLQNSNAVWGALNVRYLLLEKHT